MNTKPTLLERYWQLRLNLEAEAKTAMPEPARLWMYQEIVYRISVLEVLSLFAKSAPPTHDGKVIFQHYQVATSYIGHLKNERHFNPQDVKINEKQQTALAGLNSVIDDSLKRYANYSPESPAQYAKDIMKTIATVLPAWMQFRDTVTA